MARLLVSASITLAQASPMALFQVGVPQLLATVYIGRAGHGGRRGAVPLHLGLQRPAQAGAGQVEILAPGDGQLCGHSCGAQAAAGRGRLVPLSALRHSNSPLSLSWVAFLILRSYLPWLKLRSTGHRFDLETPNGKQTLLCIQGFNQIATQYV